MLRPLLVTVHDHRENGTRYDGPRCPLYPTCAYYAQKAMENHGILGLFMAVDRLLFREVGDLSEKYILVPARMSRAARYYDPVEDSLPLFDEKRPSLLREDFHP